MRRILGPLLALLLGTAVVYLPGLTGGFVFDDYGSILQNDAIAVERWSFANLVDVIWSGNAGPLKRPLAILSFAANFALTGAQPLVYKLTNLLIHLINGLLLYWLSMLLLRAGRQPLLQEDAARVVAFFTALLWLIHPLNLTSVLYVVQRMNSLCALFMLVALIAYCVGRQRQLGGGNGTWLLFGAVPLFGLLGLLSKENAVLLGFYCAAIEYSLFRFATQQSSDRRNLRLFYLCGVAAPLLAGSVFLLLHPDWASKNYAFRPFSPLEHLLTEARVLWWYLRMTLLPRLGELSLYHDDYIISTGLWQPASTLLAVVAWIATVTVALTARRGAPLLAFAILWFLAGHLLESTFIPLELVHEHRNYLPAAGVLLAAVCGVRQALLLASVRKPAALLAAFAAVFAFITWQRANDWSDPYTLAVLEAERRPAAYRAVYDLGRAEYAMFLLTGESQHLPEAIANLERSAALDPVAKRPYFSLLRLAYVNRLEIDPRWIDALQQRLRLTPFQPSETQEFKVLSRCYSESECRYPPEVVYQLFEAGLGNKWMGNKARAEILVSLAAFYVNAMADVATAVTVANDAVQIQPDIFGYRSMLIQLLVMAGRQDEARQAVAAIPQNARWRDIAGGSARIAAEVAALNALIAAAPPQIAAD